MSNSKPLHNPLPEPVPGRRGAMEFPIHEVDEASEEAFAAESVTAPDRAAAASDCRTDDSVLESGSADIPGVESGAGSEPDDDFDFPVDESDDFDI